jgi:dihydrofolate reductase
MRSVVLGVGISLDGYLARLNGAVDFLFMPKDYSMSSFFASVDTAIMGRKTLDAGLKMSGGSLPRSNMPMHVVSKSKLSASETASSSSTSSTKRLPLSFANSAGVPAKMVWLMGGGELGTSVSQFRFWWTGSGSVSFLLCWVKASLCFPAFSRVISRCLKTKLTRRG